LSGVVASISDSVAWVVGSLLADSAVSVVEPEEHAVSARAAAAMSVIKRFIFQLL
jgi:hypothetical protein